MNSMEQLVVFWDYACSPATGSIAEACAALSRALLPAYGASITSSRAYIGGFESILPNQQEKMLQAFKTAGIGITTYSRQESVNIERLIVVDIFTLLMDHREQFRIPPTFVLISANPTAYFYAMSKLRERGLKFIVVGNRTSQLAVQGRADVVLDWNQICGIGLNGHSAVRGFDYSRPQSGSSSLVASPQITPPRAAASSKLSPSAPAYEFSSLAQEEESTEIIDDDDSDLPSMPSSVGSAGDWDAHQVGSEALGGEKVESPFNRTPADSPVQKSTSLRDIFRSSPIPRFKYPSPIQRNTTLPTPAPTSPDALDTNIALDPEADAPVDLPVVDFWGLEMKQLQEVAPIAAKAIPLASRVIGPPPSIVAKVDAPKSVVLSPIVAPASLPTPGSPVATTSASTFSYATALAKKNAHLPGTITASGAYEPPRTTYTTTVPAPVPVPAAAPPAPKSAQPSKAAFKPLINLLRRRKAAGEVVSLRSAVGGDLVKAWPEIWSALGHDFKSYTKAAEALGLVKLGGDGGGEWVQLKI